MNRPIIMGGGLPASPPRPSIAPRRANAAATTNDERIKRIVEARKLYSALNKKTAAPAPKPNTAPVPRRRSDRLRGIPAPKTAITKPPVVRPGVVAAKKRRSSGVKKIPPPRKSLLPPPAARLVKAEAEEERAEEPSSSSSGSSESKSPPTTEQKATTVPAKRVADPNLDPSFFQPASTFDFNSLQNERKNENSRMSIMNVNIFDPVARAEYIQRKTINHKRESIRFMEAIGAPGGLSFRNASAARMSVRPNRVQFDDHVAINRISELNAPSGQRAAESSTKQADENQPDDPTTPSRLPEPPSPFYNAAEAEIQPRTLNFDLSSETSELFDLMSNFIKRFKRLNIEETQKLVGQFNNDQKKVIKTLHTLLSNP
ncbi:hypothetical protein M3Y99_00550500 [Aphelenchoides fujianensis]|nr:hypothetical protein M3Y99_00550500 [Aphelenchoides fujianensis]